MKMVSFAAVAALALARSLLRTPKAFAQASLRQHLGYNHRTPPAPPWANAKVTSRSSAKHFGYDHHQRRQKPITVSPLEFRRHDAPVIHTCYRIHAMYGAC